MNKIEVCPGTLSPGFNKYSQACIKHLFDGVNVSHILDFNYQDVLFWMKDVSESTNVHIKRECKDF